MRAPVNKILPYSVVDGPGCRAAVFFQGCDLHCAYCHNPETQRLCQSCGQCLPHCPTGALQKQDGVMVWDPERCCGCDTCLAVCPYYASPKIRWMTPQQVFEQVCQSIPFIRGITVSGGECSLYPEFLQQLFVLAHGKKLTCLMDSNGRTELSAHPALMAVCDGVMLDVKAWDPAMHRRLTGADNAPVRRNLLYLAHAQKLAEVRVVVTPGRMDPEDCIAGTAALLKAEGLPLPPLKLIRFRPFGVRGELRQAAPPSPEIMQTLAEQARGSGF